MAVEFELQGRMKIMEIEKQYEALTSIELDSQQAENWSEYNRLLASGHYYGMTKVLEEVLTRGHKSEGNILDAEHEVTGKKFRKEQALQAFSDHQNKHFKGQLYQTLKNFFKSEVKKDPTIAKGLLKILQEGFDSTKSLQNGTDLSSK